MRKLCLAVSAAALMGGFGVTSAWAATNSIVVRPGDTLWRLSQTHHVSIQALEAANPTVNPSDLLVGTVLRLPGSAATAAVRPRYAGRTSYKAPSRPKATPSTPATVTVRPGDTFWKIAQAHHLSVKALEAANPSLNPGNLLVGSVLHLPNAGAKAIDTANVKATRTVVSHPQQSLQQQNLYWMEHIINAEAGYEPLKTQIAVGDVVIHRMRSGYGRTVRDVVFQVVNGRHQFTTVTNGEVYKTPGPTSVQAAMDVLSKGMDVVPGAFVFYNPAVAPKGSWVTMQPKVAQIGHLMFAK